MRRKVLWAPFASIQEMARLYVPAALGVTVRLIPNVWDNTAAVKELACPLILIHGLVDTVVPTAQGRMVLDAHASKEKRGVFVNGLDHNSSAVGRSSSMKRIEKRIED